MAKSQILDRDCEPGAGLEDLVGLSPALPSILVVEDNPALRSLLLRALGELAKVHAVAGVDSALAWLGQGLDCDLVLCDLNLGQANAFDLLGRLEAQDPSWASRFLICTGGATHQEHRRRLQDSRLPVLQKPFAIGALRHRVQEILQGNPAANEPMAPSLQRGA